MSIVQLHQASRNWKSTIGSSPSVATRIELLNSYRQKLPMIRQITASGPEPFDQLMQTTLGYFDHWVIDLLERLDRLRNPVELLWVVRDLHREHMLFQDTTVTGIIDFGAARLDEPLIDLVRLLGSLWPLNPEVRHQLVEYYAEITKQTNLLSRYQVLDQSSTLLSAMQWLQWLVVEQRSFVVEQQVLLQRWGQLNDRLECNQW